MNIHQYYLEMSESVIVNEFLWKASNTQFVIDLFKAYPIKSELVIRGAIKAYPDIVFHVDKSIFTEDQLKYAIECDYHIISKMSSLTKDIILFAVRSNFETLSLIPKELLDDEILIAALTSEDAIIFNEIPLEILKVFNEEELNEIVKLEMITFRPDGLKLFKYPSERMIYHAVKTDGASLYYVNNKTKELKLLAILSHWPAAQLFDDEPGSQIRLDAINADWRCIYALINPNREECLLAVNHNWMALGAVPKYLLDEEMCLTAYEQNFRALRFLWPEIMFSNYAPEHNFERFPCSTDNKAPFFGILDSTEEFYGNCIADHDSPGFRKLRDFNETRSIEYALAKAKESYEEPHQTLRKMRSDIL